MIFLFISIKYLFWDIKLGMWWWWFLNDCLNDLIFIVKLLVIYYKKSVKLLFFFLVWFDSIFIIYGKIFWEVCGFCVLFYLFLVYFIGKFVLIFEIISWYFENLILDLVVEIVL